MYSEPYGRGCRIGPVDAMTAVRGDVEPIAGPQQARLGLVGKPQLGGAGKHQHPFALRLVVPEPRRARLTQRDDPFDPHTGPGQQCLGLFGCPRVGKGGKQVHDTVSSTPATARFAWRTATPSPQWTFTTYSLPVSRRTHSRCGLHTRSPYVVTAIRRLQTLRLLHACSGCFRLERLPGGTCTHWKAPPCHGAHPKRTFPTGSRAASLSGPHHPARTW